MNIFEFMMRLFWPAKPNVTLPGESQPMPTPPTPQPAPALLTAEQLQKILPKLKAEKVKEFIPFLEKAFQEFEINTPLRISAFIAQVAHESLELSVWQENLNYSAQALMKTWPKRFPTVEKANEYARKPQKIANYVYSNRLGNGDEASGDGWNFRGRGPIQLTGKENYKTFGAQLKVDLVVNPDKLLEPENGFRSAALFWKSKGLNELADASKFKEITLKINGGYLGLEHREAYWKTAKSVLGIA